jgi:hypothetical protein
MPSRPTFHNSGEYLILWRTLLGVAALGMVWVPAGAADGVAAWAPLAAIPILLVVRSRRGLIAAALCFNVPLQRFVGGLDVAGTLVACLLPLVVLSWPIPKPIPDGNGSPA